MSHHEARALEVSLITSIPNILVGFKNEKMHEVNTLKTCTLGLLLGRKRSADECTSGQYFQKRIYSFGQVYIRLDKFF